MVSPIKKYASEGRSPPRQTALRRCQGGRQRAVLRGVRARSKTAVRGVQEFALGSRGAQGWTSTNPLPEGTPERPVSALKASGAGILVSADLTKTVFGSYDSRLPEIPEGDFGLGVALYLGQADGSLEWVTRPHVENSSPAPGLIENPQLAGARRRLAGSEHGVYFWAFPNLLPEDQARVESGMGGWGLYEYHPGGVLKPAGTLPDGTEAPGGAAAANQGSIPAKQGFLFGNAGCDQHQVSRDGLSLLFVSPDPYSGASGPVELYLRRGGHSTLVSQAEDGTPAPSGVRALTTDGRGASRLGYLTPDGKDGVLPVRRRIGSGRSTHTTLPPRSTATTWKPTPSPICPVPERRSPVRTMASDSSSAAADPAAASGPRHHSYAWPGERRRVGGWPRRGLPHQVRFSSSRRCVDRGAHTITAASMTAKAIPLNRSTATTWLRARPDAFRARPMTSCPSGVRPLSTMFRADDEVNPPQRHLRRGGRVFFESPDALVPADINGKRDIYEWEGGRLTLISSGQGKQNAFFLDNKRQWKRCLLHHADGMVDRRQRRHRRVYDARAGGGFLEPVFNPCAGEACRSETSAKPAP